MLPLLQDVEHMKMWQRSNIWERHEHNEIVHMYRSILLHIAYLFLLVIIRLTCNLLFNTL
jgi:hypothetical protein